MALSEKNIWKNCLFCNIGFLASQLEINRNRGIYCSRLCANRGAGKFNATKIRNTKLKEKESNGYKKFHGRHEHRVIMEKHLNRKLLRDEIVHHKDGNKGNNDISNLEVMTQSDHARKHSTKSRKCSLNECNKKHRLNGFCEMHFARFKKYGDPYTIKRKRKSHGAESS